MIYYAHTAEDAKGNRLPESSGMWQPLADHLRNVADLAAKFAAPYAYQRHLACGDEPARATIGHPCTSQFISIPTGLGKTAA